MAEIILLITLILFFAFGYFLVGRLGRFTYETYRDAFRKKKKTVVVAEEAEEEPAPRQVKPFKCSLMLALHMAIRPH